MTGVQLAGELLRIRPDVPIILCTGFSEGITAETVRHLGILELLMKPLTLRNLSEAIRQALDAR
jgi:FixJ family two-component response regulator